MEMCKVYNAKGEETGTAISVKALISLMLVLREQFSKGNLPEELQLFFSFDGATFDKTKAVIASITFATLNCQVSPSFLSWEWPMSNQSHRCSL